VDPERLWLERGMPALFHRLNEIMMDAKSINEKAVDGDTAPQTASDQLRAWTTPKVTPARIERSTAKLPSPFEFSSSGRPFGPS
jgi:hypothetical protein